MTHSMITMLRGLFNFGRKIEEAQCVRLAFVLHNMHFPAVKHRTKSITTEQSLLHIEKANSLGLYSMALAQAFQLDCTLRQKDVIGEWVPITEPVDLMSCTKA